MKLSKILIILPLLFLSSCVDNTSPIVDVRPINDVTLVEAESYLSRILEEDDLRQKLKETIFLDFIELDNINDDFIIGEVIEKNDNSNTFTISYYHQYSNYELQLIVSLDKEPEGYLIYNADVVETTYNYSDPMFHEMHSNNVMAYLSDSSLDEENACQRFDDSNEYCMDFIYSMSIQQKVLSINNVVSFDNHFILNILATYEGSTILKKFYSTEVLIGVNDEGSFIYDLSFLKDHTTDYSDQKYSKIFFGLLDQLEDGSETYKDVCITYFYGHYDCLEELDLSLKLGHNVIFTKSFGIENSYLDENKSVLNIVYNPDLELPRINIDYDIYETDNGHVFFTPHTFYDPIIFNDDGIDVALNDMIMKLYTDLKEEDFCTLKPEIFNDCDNVKSLLPLQDYTVEVVDIRGYREFSTIVHLIDNITGDYYEINARFQIFESPQGVLSIKHLLTSSIEFHVGLEQSFEVFKQFFIDLGNKGITTEEITQKYYTDFYITAESVRTTYYDMDMAQFVSNWTFEPSAENNVILVTTTPFDSTIGVEKTLSVRIEYNENKYTIFFNPADFEYSLIDESNKYVHLNNLINTLENSLMTDDEICELLHYENNCHEFRALITEDTTDIYVSDLNHDEGMLHGNFLLYDTETGEVLANYEYYILSVNSLTVVPVDLYIVRSYNLGNPYLVHSAAFDVYQNYTNVDVSNEEYCQDFPDFSTCLVQREVIFTAFNSEYNLPFFDATTNLYYSYIEFYNMNGNLLGTQTFTIKLNVIDNKSVFEITFQDTLN